MEPSSRLILNQALKLPANERAEVAEHLIQSLDPQGDREVGHRWQQEIQQRLSEINRGVVRPIPWEDVQRPLTYGH